MKCHFVVGQKVVCVDDGWTDGQMQCLLSAGVSVPQKNTVYTVREVLFGVIDEPVIRLFELVNPGIEYSDVGHFEHAWSQEMFRPVAQRKTDISIFTDMLIEQKQPVNA